MPSLRKSIEFDMRGRHDSSQALKIKIEQNPASFLFRVQLFGLAPLEIA